MTHVLALVTDGFGAKGGIARYNTAFLTALSTSSQIRNISVLPRFGAIEAALPEVIHQHAAAAGKIDYIARLARMLVRREQVDLVFCGHLNMAPLADWISRLLGCPWWLQIHGIEAWTRPAHLARKAVNTASLVTAVSRYTRRRFLSWADLTPERVRVLPNTYDPRFTPGSKSPELLERYKLLGYRVLLTVGRLATAERYKGHDRVIEALAVLRQQIPDLAYLVVGDGDDRPRLKRLAEDSGVADICRFVGHVPDNVLIEHMYLADLFVMPSTGEGFGIVFLEAMACGIPAIGLDADGSVDPLSIAALGHAVAPPELVEAIKTCFVVPASSMPPPELAERFGREAFTTSVARLSASLRSPGAKAECEMPGVTHLTSRNPRRAVVLERRDRSISRVLHTP